MNEALDLLRPLMREKSIRLETTVRTEMPLVECDRERILQVLSNLMATRSSSPPTRAPSACAPSGLAVSIALRWRDTGPGIPRDQQSHLFDRYWRGDSQERQGNGLGLYIAEQIVLAHGKTDGAFPNREAGSSFRCPARKRPGASVL